MLSHDPSSVSHDVRHDTGNKNASYDAPMHGGRTSFFHMTLLFLASFVLPLGILTSAVPQTMAYRHDATPTALHHAASSQSSSSSVSSSATGTGSNVITSLFGRIERERAARLAAHPGVVPLKPAAPEPPARPDNHIGTYLGAGAVRNNELLTATMDEIVKTGGSSIVFEVKADRVYYATKAPMANDLKLISNASAYDLDYVIAEAKKRNLYTIARYVSLKDEGLYDAAPDSRVKNPKTGADMAAGWTDGASPTTLEYNRQIICELASKGIGEINLDYIRFSTSDFGNLKVFTGQQKADHVMAFIKMAREAIDSCGPSTKLGLSTFAILGWDYDINEETLGQDVKQFAPLVDIISPMAYPAAFTSPEYYVAGRDPRSRMYWLVYHTLTGYKTMLGDDANKIRPWIQGYYVTAQNMRDQMDAVTDAGLCGFQVWNANAHYDAVYTALAGWKQPDSCK